VHDISTRVAGYVQSVNVDDNEFVKAGQTLVVLAIGLLVSAAAIWVVKVPKSASAQVPAH